MKTGEENVLQRTVVLLTEVSQHRLYGIPDLSQMIYAI